MTLALLRGWPTVVPHYYWRLYFPNPAPGFNYNIRLAEVEMYSTVGGADICSGGTASASENSGSASNLFDNDTGTIWNSAIAVTDKWVAYQFATKVDVVQFKLTNGNGNYKDVVKLQYSDDGVAWTDATPLMAATRGTVGGSQTYRVGGTKTYWRINATALNGWFYLNIAELEFRATHGGADQSAPGQPGKVDGSRFSVNFEEAAVDNDTATYWESRFTTTGPWWIWYVFEDDIDVTELLLKNGPNFDEAPVDFQIQYSGDGINWNTAHTVTGSTGWVGWETRTFSW